MLLEKGIQVKHYKSNIIELIIQDSPMMKRMTNLREKIIHAKDKTF